MGEAMTDFDKEESHSPRLSGTHEWVLHAIFDELEHIRNYFPAFFDLNADLPSRFHLFFKASEHEFSKILLANLNNYALDKDLINLIQSYVAATDRSEKFRLKKWRQWSYLLKAVKALADFFNTPPDGDLTLDLLKLLICLDFNSLHVYTYFLKYTERITLIDLSFQEQQEQLLYLVKVFRQVRVESEQRYDPRVQSLKTSVLDSLSAELTYLEEKHKLLMQNFKSTTAGSPSRFYFTVLITLAELMFFFRIMLEVGVIQTKFNSYLYEFVANHIRTQRAENISKKSMRNHFSNKPFPDKVVQNVRAWLTKMIGHIDLYYKINS
jgi:hypothetical protein